jgi:predicted RNA-binding protein YlqC (UPF0109 family)
MQSQSQQFLEYIVKSLVEYPDAVLTSRTVDNLGVLVELTVHPDDMGKIIGRDGHTAQAIRTIMKAFGKKNQANISVRIKEPEGAGSAKSEGIKSLDEAVESLNL